MSAASPFPSAAARSGSRHILREVLEAALVAVLLASFARTFVVQAFRIPTASMEPNLLVGDHLLVNKFVYGPTAFEWERRLLPLARPAPGEVVVFRFPPDPERDFIKRCVAVGGQRLEVTGKRLLRDGVPVTESGYAHYADPRVYPDSPFLDDYYRRRDNLGPLLVPPGHFFFLGDNRDLSHDSRYWGPVPRSHVKGRALLVYWSLQPVPSTGPGRLVEWLERLRGFFGHTRWSRTLRLVR